VYFFDPYLFVISGKQSKEPVIKSQSVFEQIVRTLCICLLFVATSALIPFNLMAQELPPQVADPAIVEKEFDEKLLPSSEVEISAEMQPHSMPKELANIRFTLRQLEVRGVTALDDIALKPVYEAYLGREVSVQQAFEIAGELTALYRNAGYILSKVIVPPQKIEDGFLLLTAVEGFIGRVLVDCEVARGRDHLRKIGEKLKAEKPLTADRLERYVMLANDLPGITVRAVLKASDIPGATDLTLVATRDNVHVFGSVNNRGSRYNGPVQMQAGVALSNVFNAFSKTGIRVATSGQTREFIMADLKHQMWLGTEGTRADALIRYTQSRPGADLRDLQIETKAKSARLSLVHPITRSRAKSFYIRGGVAFRDTETTILAAPHSEDRTRKAFLGMRFDFVDSLKGINLVDVEASQGLEIFNATNRSDHEQSRIDADPAFTKVNVTAMRLQKLHKKVNLLLEVTGQYSDSGLVASEEFAIGGAVLGRAFDPAAVTGDYGGAARLELQFNGTSKAPAIVDRYQLYAFADYGRAWNYADAKDPSTDLGSVGAGIRLQVGEHVSTKVEVAHAYEKTPSYLERWGNAVRIFFGLNFTF
jgi:hemolysin activation/secretion protein